MEHGKDVHLRLGDLKNDRVGKTADKDATKVFVNLRIHQRLPGQTLKGGLHTSEELVPKSRSTFFVPVVGFGQVLFSLWSEY